MGYEPEHHQLDTLLCIEGNGEITCGDEKLVFSKGDTIFIPAGSCQCKVSGKVDYLDICC